MPDSRADGRTGRRAAFLQKVLGAPIGSFLRQIAGMPDYPAHVEHLRRCHPERPVPSEREFFEEYLRARYGDGPTRCC